MSQINKNHLNRLHCTTSKDKFWQLTRTLSRTYSTISTGFPELNDALKLGGWPLETTTELAMPHYGIGELRLLMPALRHLLDNGSGYVVWIAPPYLPYAPALVKEQIDPGNLIMVRTKSIIDTLWAAEQALLANSCTAVFTWTGKHNLNQKQARRLQLAVEKSNVWHVQFRHSTCLQQASAARLRLGLQNNNFGELDITVRKQPQGGVNQNCTISLEPHYDLWQRIPPKLLPQHNKPLLKEKIKQPRKTSLPKGILSQDLLAD